MQKNWKRHILIGFVVALLFFGWFLRGFLWINWRFKLFSGRSWRFLLKEYRSGWMLSALSDWIFLFSLCFAVPVFLYLWYLCTKVKWRSLFKKILKAIKKIILWPFQWFKKYRKKRQEKNNTWTIGTGVAAGVGVAAAVGNSKRPKAITVQHTGTVAKSARTESKSTFQMSNYNTPYSAPKTNPVPPYPDMGEEFVKGRSGLDMENESYASNMTAEVANTPLDEIRLPERQAVNEDLDAIWTERGYHTFKDVVLSSGTLDFVAVSKDTVWACALDKAPSDWLADEESFNGEDPLWFSETDHRTSPIFILQKMCNELKTKLADVAKDLAVKPLLIEQKGNIINAEDMMKSWVEMGVAVCRTDIGGPDDLSTFGDFLKAAEAPSAELIDAIQKELGKGE